MTAAANAKVPDRLFKIYGHWKSKNTKDGYVKDQVQSRLKTLGMYPINTFIDASFVALVINCH